MKVVACEKCGAKYQIDNMENVNNYECSVCAGNLIEVEEYPSYSSTNQNKSNTLYQNLNDPNLLIVYCESCGLKYNLNKNEYPEDYECSSCFGNLRYIDEELNKDLEKRLSLRPQNSNNNVESNKISNSSSKLESDVIYPVNKLDINQIEEKLRNDIKYEFSNNLAQEYNNINNSDGKSGENLLNDQSLENKDPDNIERNEKKLEKSNSSIFEKIAIRGNKENENELSENINVDKEIAQINNPSKTADEQIDEFSNKDNKKQELVPYPNIKNTSYHDVYIIAGLILILIGFADILLSQRIYSVIFIAIGFILFGIGVMQNKKYTATEKRGKIIREKLLTLPENFYVLYFVKAPNSNDGINHVVVGASGIFAIVSQSYHEKEDKEKPKTDTENINLTTKSKLDNLDILGISEIVEQANDNYENNKKKKKIADENIEKNTTPIEDKKPKVGKFKFRETPLKFEHNNKIKQKSIQLSEELIDFLNENGLNHCYVEPLVGFVNNDVAVINMPLTDEDLFLDELLYKIIHGRRQLDDITTHKVAVLLSQYSTECSS